MTTQIRAWKPLFEGDTVSIAVTATSQFLAVPKTPMGVRALRLVNIGTNVIFFELVESAATAATAANSIPMLPNTAEVFTFVNDEVGLAVIAAATGNTLYVTAGEGL